VSPPKWGAQKIVAANVPSVDEKSQISAFKASGNTGRKGEEVSNRWRRSGAYSPAIVTELSRSERGLSVPELINFARSRAWQLFLVAGVCGWPLRVGLAR
jgi:hypothetical protein